MLAARRGHFVTARAVGLPIVSSDLMIARMRHETLREVAAGRFCPFFRICRAAA